MTFFIAWGRHLRDAWRSLFRNGWMSFASLLTMTTTLMMIGGLVFLMVNVENITQDIEKGISIRTYIDIVAEEDDEKELETRIKDLEHVTSVTYRTKEEEYEDLVKQMGDEFELFEGDANPFFNVLLVDVDDTSHLASVTEEIRQLPMVADVTYGEIETENLIRTMDIARIVFALVAAILVVVAVLLISNTIRLTIYARADEIEIMRLVGASNSYVRAPFLIEGSIIGILSALLASGLLVLFYQGLQRATVEIVGARIINFAPIYPLILFIGGALGVIGLLLGIMGARRSMKQFLQI